MSDVATDVETQLRPIFYSFLVTRRCLDQVRKMAYGVSNCGLKKKCELLLSLNLVGQDASTDKHGYFSYKCNVMQISICGNILVGIRVYIKNVTKINYPSWSWLSPSEVIIFEISFPSGPVVFS